MSEVSISIMLTVTGEGCIHLTPNLTQIGSILGGVIVLVHYEHSILVVAVVNMKMNMTILWKKDDNKPEKGS